MVQLTFPPDSLYLPVYVSCKQTLYIMIQMVLFINHVQVFFFYSAICCSFCSFCGDRCSLPPSEALWPSFHQLESERAAENTDAWKSTIDCDKRLIVKINKEMKSSADFYVIIVFCLEGGAVYFQPGSLLRRRNVTVTPEISSVCTQAGTHGALFPAINIKNRITCDVRDPNGGARQQECKQSSLMLTAYSPGC